MAFMDCQFFSESLGLSTAMYVVIPETGTGQIGMKSGARRGRKFPVLYLLHGLSDDHTIWMRHTSIERYASERGIAVVMPAAGRSYYQDMAAGLRYWTHISEEVPRLARFFFPLSDRRQDNYVAGLSMGGYGAFRMAFSHPGRFAAAGSFSGALDVVNRIRAVRRDAALDHNEMKHMFGSKLAVKNTSSDLFLLARRMARRGPCPRLYQYCGTSDFLYQDNLAFRNHATKLGLDLTYAEEEGGDHSWPYWDRQVLAFLKWLTGR